MYSEIHQPNISYICEYIATTLKHIFMVKHTQDSINITAIKVGAKDTTTFSKRCHDSYITSSFFVNILLVVYFCPCLLCFFKEACIFLLRKIFHMKSVTGIYFTLLDSCRQDSHPVAQTFLQILNADMQTNASFRFSTAARISRVIRSCQQP